MLSRRLRQVLMVLKVWLLPATKLQDEECRSAAKVSDQTCRSALSKAVIAMPFRRNTRTMSTTTVSFNALAEDYRIRSLHRRILVPRDDPVIAPRRAFDSSIGGKSLKQLVPRGGIEPATP